MGIGLGAVYVRGKALSGRIDTDKVRAALAADAWWALAAILWVGSGLWRLFGSIEKDTAYYMGNHVFWTKMVLFVGILLMEIRPMMTLARWRRELARGIPPNTSNAHRISRAQLRAGRAGRAHGSCRDRNGPRPRRLADHVLSSRRKQAPRPAAPT